MAPTIDLGNRLIDWEFGLTIFQWEYLLYLLIVLISYLAARYTYSLPYLWYFRKATTKFSLKTQLVDRDNKAVAVSYSAYLLAIALILWGSLTDLTEDPWLNIGLVAFYQVIGMVLLFISRIINDLVIVGIGGNIKSLVEDGNIAVACVEGGSMISAGQVAMACVSGSVTNWGDDIASTFLFFGLGQLAFVLFAFIYRLVVRPSYNVHEELSKGNIAAGISYGGMLIAVGILVSNPIMKSDSLVAFALMFSVGGVVLLLLRFIVDFILLPKAGLNKEIVQDQNWGAAIVDGGMEIVYSFIIAVFLRDSCSNA